MSPPDWQRILGVRFFNGPASEAVDYITRVGGYTVVPAAPALVKIESDPAYRRALVEADLAIADSGFMVLLWRLLHRRVVARISGLKYLRILLANPQLRERGSIFLVLPHKSSREKALRWLQERSFATTADDCYIAPIYQRSEVGDQRSDGDTQGYRASGKATVDQPSAINHQPSHAPPLPGGEGRVRASDLPSSISHLPAIEDRALIAILEQRKPKHIIVGIGGGIQEKLGFYLREHLSYRPAIHCIGAALAFLTGDQKPIPMWADRLYLGWFLRLARAPRHYARRFSPAFRLPGMIWRYGSDLPALAGSKEQRSRDVRSEK